MANNWPILTDDERVKKVRTALTKAKGNLSAAAEAIGVSRQTLTTFAGRFSKRLGLDLTTTCPHCGKSVPLRRRAGASRRETAAMPA
jgi:hypothetical protein